jgi:hypothetical protein
MVLVWSNIGTTIHKHLPKLHITLIVTFVS